MAEYTARVFSKWKRVLCVIVAILWQWSHSALGDECGPLGYNIKDLLRPNYWFLDMTNEDCQKLHWFGTLNKTKIDHCRLYMNLCRAMTFQCSGALCLRYLDTSDYVSLLGYAAGDPFHEGHQTFTASYRGKDKCKGTNKILQSKVSFYCNHTASWNTTALHFDNGARAPPLRAMLYNNKTCELTLEFNYSGACISTKPGEEPGHTISVGSIILILFFPGLVLYFLVGILINRMAGRRGTELIPHSSFWLDLPDLIMEGFIFSMGVLTCRKDEPRMKYENM